MLTIKKKKSRPEILFRANASASSEHPTLSLFGGLSGSTAVFPVVQNEMRAPQGAEVGTSPALARSSTRPQECGLAGPKVKVY